MFSNKPPSSLWTGKARATTSNNDFDQADLNPVITYRHLHSHNLGVKDPLRVIALCDSDAFYAACEQVRLGLDPSIPLVVLQWDSLIAVNYPARTYGISRMNKVKDALQKCPHLRVVHVATYKEGETEPGYWDDPDTLTHKVSLDYYRRESWKIYHMFKDGLPTGEIEKASIDEAFIDFTQPVREELLKRYPHLATVPLDAPDGKDTPLPPPPPHISWDKLGTVVPIDPSPAPREPQNTREGPTDASQDNEHEGNMERERDMAEMSVKTEPECATEEDDGTTTWHDVALSIAAELMSKIRHDIHMKLGYTTSAGIARNKFLAKLSASYRKPNGQSVLRNAAIPNYLRPMPFQKIRFLGGKLGTALAQEYDVSLVSDLLTVSLDEMQRKFGEESIWVWEILRGIDRTEVKEKPPITKSMLASKNLPQPITKASQGHHWVRVLAAELALRLREARESIPALWPKSIVLHVRQGYEGFRSKQTPFPFTRDITVDGIAHAGDKLWKELVGTDATRKAPLKVTNVQLSFSGIESMETGQRMIEGFFAGTGRAVASGGKALVKRKRSDSDSDSGAGASSAGPSRQRWQDGGEFEDEEVELVHGGAEATENEDNRFTYTCTRCGHRVSLSSSVRNDTPRGASGHGNGDGVALGVEGLDDEEADAIIEALERSRREHEDFHFAQDLQNAGNASGRLKFKPGYSRTTAAANENKGSSKAAANKKKKSTAAKPMVKTKERKGTIAQFFVQK